MNKLEEELHQLGYGLRLSKLTDAQHNAATERRVASIEAKQRIDAALNTPTSALKEIRELKARVTELEATLSWYGEQVSWSRHFDGDGPDARHNLADDGGKKAFAVLKGEET